MNRTYTIRYLRTAEADLLDIFEYIKRDNFNAAASLLERFDTTISRLTTHPLSGVVPKDERLKRLGYRILVVDKYLVFYVIKAKTIQVRRVIHGKRKYGFLL